MSHLRGIQPFTEDCTMTTTTDLLRRTAKSLRFLAKFREREHKPIEVIELSKDAASLLALADEWERAEPVAWLESPYGKCKRNPAYTMTLPQAVAWRIPLYTHPAPEVTHPLEHLLPELCQLLDAFKREAENNGEGWTEWDESVRARLRKCIAEHNIAAMQEPKP